MVKGNAISLNSEEIRYKMVKFDIIHLFVAHVNRILINRKI